MLPVQTDRIQMNNVERKLASIKLLNYLDATKVIFQNRYNNLPGYNHTNAEDEQKT